MTLLKHEIRHNAKSLIIWSISLSAIVIVMMMLFPQMENQMKSFTEMYKNLGGFSEAFGMDKLNFGTAIGFYGIECGSIYSIGGAMFAAVVGINSLSKEEGRHTAEFLASHPISRRYIVTQKLTSVILQVAIINIVILVSGIVSFKLIGKNLPMEKFLTYHMTLFFMMLQIAFICFGVSAFLRRETMGLGIGISLIFYFMNIVINVSSKAEDLRYFTPHYYSDPSRVIGANELDWILVGAGILTALVFVLLGYIRYSKKDLSV